MNPLIEPTKLAELLADPSSQGAAPTVTVLDVRYRLSGPSGRGEYVAGHIPGAAFVDLDADLAAAPGAGGRHPLPTPENFGAAMRRCGVDNDRRVVIYDDWASHAAARCWWLLRYFGHRHVQVLDGGWQGWQRSGGAVEFGDTPTVAGDFTPAASDLAVVQADDLARVDLVIDARAPERFRGEVEPVDRVAGHIPGARNVPTSANLDAQGRFLAPTTLRALYDEVGADEAEQIAVYCGSGVTACVDILALELTGRWAALYPGSWSGWITDPQRPIATED